MSRRGGRIVIGVAMGVAAAMALAGWYAYRICYTLKGLPDAYAMWDAGNLVIEYMETHAGRWPGGWEDLRGSYAALRRRTGEERMLRSGMSLEQLRERIGIDFTADPAELAKAKAEGGKAPFRVVSALSGNRTLWKGAEPNAMILDYLRDREARAAASRPAK